MIDNRGVLIYTISASEEHPGPRFLNAPTFYQLNTRVLNEPVELGNRPGAFGSPYASSPFQSARSR